MLKLRQPLSTPGIDDQVWIKRKWQKREGVHTACEETIALNASLDQSQSLGMPLSLFYNLDSQLNKQ